MTQPPLVSERHLLTAAGAELARQQDNRVYLIGLVAQQSERIAELEDQVVQQAERITHLETPNTSTKE